MLVASILFGASGIGSSEGGASPAMLAFLACVVVSRFGLYGFDVALLQLEQVRARTSLVASGALGGAAPAAVGVARAVARVVASSAVSAVACAVVPSCR